jgi:hypothetical protein
MEVWLQVFTPTERSPYPVGWVGLRDEHETLWRRKNKSLSRLETQFSDHPVRNLVTDRTTRVIFSILKSTISSNLRVFILTELYSICCLFFAGCWSVLFFGLEYAGSAFIRKVSEHLPDCTGSHPKRRYSS